MKRFFIIAAVLFAVTEAKAQDYKMVITYNDGTLELFDVNDVESVKYSSDVWNAYAKGVYTYDEDCPANDTRNSVQKEYTLYRSEANPTRWRIENWGLGQTTIDFYFTYIEETGYMMVDQQYSGYTDDYERTWIVQDDYYGYDDDPDFDDGSPRSYYDEDTFNFTLKYCPSNGGYLTAYETFRITELLQ